MRRTSVSCGRLACPRSSVVGDSGITHWIVSGEKASLCSSVLPPLQELQILTLASESRPDTFGLHDFNYLPKLVHSPVFLLWDEGIDVYHPRVPHIEADCDFGAEYLNHYGFDFSYVCELPFQEAGAEIIDARFVQIERPRFRSHENPIETQRNEWNGDQKEGQMQMGEYPRIPDHHVEKEYYREPKHNRKEQ
ncbi:MAG: hypothetical protein LN409_00295 [Candidatus Thermoplasmatota archaeon]|nr:hypothetical protein [Candidatus Thermoplasmatota archaeon]